MEYNLNEVISQGIWAKLILITCIDGYELKLRQRHLKFVLYLNDMSRFCT